MQESDKASTLSLVDRWRAGSRSVIPCQAVQHHLAFDFHGRARGEDRIDGIHQHVLFLHFLLVEEGHVSDHLPLAVENRKSVVAVELFVARKQFADPCRMKRGPLQVEDRFARRARQFELKVLAKAVLKPECERMDTLRRPAIALGNERA